VKLFGYIYYITTKLNYERTDNTQPHDWRKGQCRVSTLELAYPGFVDGNDQNRRGERQALLRHGSDREMDKQPRSHGPAGTRARVSQLVMKKVEVTMQEIWAATRPIVQKNKKKYTRKKKKDDWTKELGSDSFREGRTDKD
jgi:hypothetical protein